MSFDRIQRVHLPAAAHEIEGITTAADKLSSRIGSAPVQVDTIAVHCGVFTLVRHVLGLVDNAASSAASEEGKTVDSRAVCIVGLISIAVDRPDNLLRYLTIDHQIRSSIFEPSRPGHRPEARIIYLRDQASEFSQTSGRFEDGRPLTLAH
ncbi:MAG: hypothetical protein ACI8XO_002603 [Verrucomicrobiales bacterium]|jgi:hypothetical protein